MLEIAKMRQGASSNFNLEKHFKSRLPNLQEVDFHYLQSVRSVFCCASQYFITRMLSISFWKVKLQQRLNEGCVMVVWSSAVPLGCNDVSASLTVPPLYVYSCFGFVNNKVFSVITHCTSLHGLFSWCSLCRRLQTSRYKWLQEGICLLKIM